jgi:hypothetical protein
LNSRNNFRDFGICMHAFPSECSKRDIQAFIYSCKSLVIVKREGHTILVFQKPTAEISALPNMLSSDS